MPIRLPDALPVDRAVMARTPQTGRFVVLDHLAVNLSRIGEVSGVWFVLTVVAFLAHRLSTRQAIICALAIMAEWVITNRFVKHQMHRDRPTPEQPDPKGVRRPTSSSFPSGHSSASAFSAALVGSLSGWWIPMGILAVALGWSRMHLRVHYPTDVVAGWLWGAALGLVTAAFLG
jgi:membrane-associated phospholipid phosphatase